MTACPISPLLPSFGGEPNYSTVIYPNPPSHDFCIFLIISELMRRLHQSSAPLDVILLLNGGKLGYADFSHFSFNSGSLYPIDLPKKYSDIMIPNVLIPAAQMIGASVRTLDIRDNPPKDLFLGRVEYDYHLSSLVDASRAGFEIPQWTIPTWAFEAVHNKLKGRCPITITLRETDNMPERNSRLNHWKKFALELCSHLYDVIIIRDTSQADWSFEHFDTWKEPAKNSFLRAALYNCAQLNLMVGTGPIMWPMFSPAPFLLFKQLVPSLPYWQQGTPEGWREQEHLEVGDQLTWATPFQKITWKDDTFPNIWEEFEQMMEKMEK